MIHEEEDEEEKEDKTPWQLFTRVCIELSLAFQSRSFVPSLLKIALVWSAWPAQSVGRGTLDRGGFSSSLMLGQSLLKKKFF